MADLRKKYKKKSLNILEEKELNKHVDIGAKKLIKKYYENGCCLTKPEIITASSVYISSLFYFYEELSYDRFTQGELEEIFNVTHVSIRKYYRKIFQLLPDFLLEEVEYISDIRDAREWRKEFLGVYDERD